MNYQNFVIAFQPNVDLIEESENAVVIKSKSNYLRIKKMTTGLSTIVKILADDGASEEKLSNLVFELDGSAQLPLFYYYLQQFNAKRFLSYTITWEGESLATIFPTSQYYQSQPKKLSLTHKYILSRFAFFHRETGQFILESPLSDVKIILNDSRIIGLITGLSHPQSYSDLCLKNKDFPEYIIKTLLQSLLDAEAISILKDNGLIEEEENIGLTHWDFHDLLFHSRSRQGRHDNPFGATYRFINKIEPLPAINPSMSGEIIDLDKPDIKTLKENDLPFSFVLEERKSIRNYADEPITNQQLGEFLYRVARVREIMLTEPQELSNRPYPSGGAIYELELYLVVNTCQNLASGLYHYNPLEHQLCKILDKNQYADELLLTASVSAARLCTPQVLIIIAARFPRIFWKYNSMAYAALLKNVGVLYQTMYLVATAMNLAPCGLGCGNSDLFVKAFGTDYYMETSVGEFMLGSKTIH